MYPFLGIFGCYVLMLRAYGLPSYSSDMWRVCWWELGVCMAVVARGHVGVVKVTAPYCLCFFSSLLYDKRLSFAEG